MAMAAAKPSAERRSRLDASLKTFHRSRSAARSAPAAATAAPASNVAFRKSCSDVFSAAEDDNRSARRRRPFRGLPANPSTKTNESVSLRATTAGSWSSTTPRRDRSATRFSRDCTLLQTASRAASRATALRRASSIRPSRTLTACLQKTLSDAGPDAPRTSRATAALLRQRPSKTSRSSRPPPSRNSRTTLRRQEAAPRTLVLEDRPQRRGVELCQKALTTTRVALQQAVSSAGRGLRLLQNAPALRKLSVAQLKRRGRRLAESRIHGALTHG